MTASLEPEVAVRSRWRFGRWRVRLSALALLLILAWFAGLIWFAQTIPTTITDPDSPTDAIVVLTGGSLRLEHGLDLLVAGRAKKLFVSGVHQGVATSDLLRVSHQVPSWVTCCIELGHDADSTLGNAIETAAWMRHEGYGSLRLVTSSYHMRRSLFEFSRVMPEARIIAHPVFPERIKSHWWSSASTVGLIVNEYTKYLGARLRAAIGAPVDETSSAATHAAAKGGTS